MRRFKIAAAGVTAAALLVLPSTGANAGNPRLMEADPNSGSPDDSFEVRNLEGSTCFSNQVSVTVDGSAPFGDEAATDEFFKGDWEVSFTVPAGSTPGPYVINATCVANGKSFDYVPVTYTVLGEASPSPLPSASPSPSPSENPDVGAGREETPAAQPEVEAAAFTG